MNSFQDIEEIVDERNMALSKQREYYEHIQYEDINPLDPDTYYESLIDRSEFKAPRDNSERNAARDAGINIFLQFKSWFSKDAKRELMEKKRKANDLTKQYSENFQKNVERRRTQFYKNQELDHLKIDSLRKDFYSGNQEQIIEYYNAVLHNDHFTLDLLNEQMEYDNMALVTSYDPTLKILSFRYRIPNADEICVISRFYPNKDMMDAFPKDLDEIYAIKVRRKLMKSLVLRSVAIIFCSDKYGQISKLNITGFLHYYDSAYGHDRNLDVVKLQISKEEFNEIDLYRASVTELFDRVWKKNYKESSGLYDKNPYELKQID
jgi:hypothetical protein